MSLTGIEVAQIGVYFIVLLVCVKPLGWYMAQIYQGKPCALNQIGAPVERFIYRLACIDKDQKMDWKQYAGAMLCFNALGLLTAYMIVRLQFYLPFNLHHFASLKPALAFNSAISFTTNTDWQPYVAETTMSYLTQTLAWTVQNFLSAATGMAVLIALIRGIQGQLGTNLGNFWVDMIRSILYILLPLSLLFSMVLVSQGVIQNFKADHPVYSIESEAPLSIPMGPVASQVAIKQLGTNGGGFFCANSAHPFENPTPLSNFLEMLAILLIPASLCYTFGLMVKDKRQGWAILSVMVLTTLFCSFITVCFEQQGNFAVDKRYGTEMVPRGGNMEGKETRFGVVNSALFSVITTASSNGALNAAQDAYTPLGGLIPLWLIQTGEVIFGGVGSGLYGMLIYLMITIFIAGLMVGRTPEYLGKKIEAFEMKMASVFLLIMPLVVLLCTAITVIMQVEHVQIISSQRGSHQFTQILYAFSSMCSNNGSSLAILNMNTDFYNILGGFAMLIGRYVPAICILAIAGSLANKKIIPISAGTFETHTPLFMSFLFFIIITISILSFFPAVALGPFVEQLELWRKYHV